MAVQPKHATAKHRTWKRYVLRKVDVPRFDAGPDPVMKFLFCAEQIKVLTLYLGFACFSQVRIEERLLTNPV